MEKKFLKTFVAVFAVLAIIASFPWLDEKIRGEKKEKPVLGADLSGFTKESVDKIVIRKVENEKRLVFEGGKWFVGENEADQKKIDELFSDFSRLKIKEIASQNEANFSKFDVTKDLGVELRISQNGKESLFWVGKMAAAATEFYLRKDGSKNVYLASGNLREKLLWEESKWKIEAEEEKKEAGETKEN